VPKFTMPSLGADMDAGTLVEWLVHEGDTVHRGDPMAVVDTDKSAIEVESFDEGVVESFLVEPGTRVAVGTPLATLTSLGAAAETVPAEAARIPEPREPGRRAPVGTPPLRHHAAELGVDLAKVVGTGEHGTITRTDVDRAAAEAATAAVHPPAAAPLAPAPVPAPAPAPATVATRPAAPGAPVAGQPTTQGHARVSPYARRLAGELGVDLARVTGSGPDGSVRAEDVRSAAAQPAAPPAAARSSRATIAALMSRAKREIPHYYVATTVDLGQLTDWLRRTNKERAVSERIVPAAAVLKATALAAREHPELNGFWVDDGFVPGEDVHLGVAVHVRDGALVAPALHHTADLALPEVMAALRDLVKRARAGRLRRAEMADPTLTVTDLGDQGVEEVIGVIYAPQVALLGVGRVVERPWAVDGLIGVRPTVRLTLSGDHRATDGATGAQFLNTLERLLQHPEEL